MIFQGIISEKINFQSQKFEKKYQKTAVHKKTPYIQKKRLIFIIKVTVLIEFFTIWVYITL